MSILSNRLLQYVGLIVASLSMYAFAVFVSSPVAHASTLDILAGQNLQRGSPSQNVSLLQGLLSELGYLNIPYGVAFGYYGPLTANAVSAYQVDRNVVPSLGTYGPVTKLAMYSDFETRGWLNMLGWQD